MKPMLRAFVIDDEKPTTDLIARYLHQTGLVEVVDKIINPLLVLERIEQEKPDVIFMDIEMPELTGLELAELISEKYDFVDIVFVTAYQQYALEAFRVNAMDYVVKPVQQEELSRVVQKIAKKRRIQPKENEQSQSFSVCIRSFGGLSVRQNGEALPIKWPTIKCKELLAYMLFQKEGLLVSKWKLFDLLWPDKEDHKSEINLRSTVFRLNKAMSENGIDLKVSSTKSGYQIYSGDFQIDTNSLEKLSKVDFRQYTIEALEEVSQRFYEWTTGEFLEELESDWHLELQAYYGKLILAVGLQLIERYVSLNKYLEAYQLLIQLLKSEPYNEELHEKTVQVLFRLEGAINAKQYYDEYAYKLYSELKQKPRLEWQILLTSIKP